MLLATAIGKFCVRAFQDRGAIQYLFLRGPLQCFVSFFLCLQVGVLFDLGFVQAVHYFIDPLLHLALLHELAVVETDLTGGQAKA